MKKIFLSAVVLGLAFAASAQQENLSNSTKPVHLNEPPVDGYVVKTDIENRKIIPYAPVRQTDVAFSKRVWREIDLREKMNKAFASPKSNLMKIIIDAIKNGELTAYDPTPTENDPNGDSFKNILPLDQVLARLTGGQELIEEFDAEGNTIGSRYEDRAFDFSQVVKFRIKEDWIFDKQRSIFEPRIVGIAPLFTPQIAGLESTVDLPANSDGGPVGTGTTNNEAYDPFDPFAVQPAPQAKAAAADPFQTQPTSVAIPAFWIYFPEARHVFVNKEVMNRHNDATGLSYDDVFVKRIFSSYIVKESNPEDLRIQDYTPDERERLYESERIKKSLMDWEQDLWSY